ncbi:MAG: FkbM family methyltransferase [Campylobacterota bacterium]|nr:FkbM family methyltransferase [Campylobacterota bacterium]
MVQDFIDFDYINKKDKELTSKFLFFKNVKKYILGINKLTKSILKHIEVDGIVDDFTRVQSSRRKKDIFQIEDIPKDSIILWTSSGSPLEVKNKLDAMGFENISYLAFYKYSGLELAKPPFIVDFKNDYLANKSRYDEIYNILADEKSKDVFTKVINFKISFDFEFMNGFTNDFKGQYFDEELIPKIKDIVFLDGGGYIGDTIPNIIENFPDFKKIYVVEPSELHIGIAKKEFGHLKNIEFINCGLGSIKSNSIIIQDKQDTCNHNYQAENLNTIDNIITQKVDFIKLDIEGAEQDAIDGAKKTIKNYKPILAICIYHKAEDWYKIPQKVLEINSDYKIYIRHYMEGIFETVMYFIPKNK